MEASTPGSYHTRVFVEILAVLGAFVLPGVLVAAPIGFSSLVGHALYWLSAASQTALAVLLAGKGFALPRARDVAIAAVTGAGLIALTMLLSLAERLVFGLSPSGATGSDIAPSKNLVPAALVTCLATGYREESIFRLWLHEKLAALGLSATPRIVLSSIIFGAAHLGSTDSFGGAVAEFVIAAVAGAALGLVWEKTRSLHGIALGHAVHNAIALSIT